MLLAWAATTWYYTGPSFLSLVFSVGRCCLQTMITVKLTYIKVSTWVWGQHQGISAEALQALERRWTWYCPSTRVWSRLTTCSLKVIFSKKKKKLDSACPAGQLLHSGCNAVVAFVSWAGIWKFTLLCCVPGNFVGEKPHVGWSTI